MKKFELSAYGVEEMEQKELIEVNGGEPISISVVIAAATLLFTIIGTIAAIHQITRNSNGVSGGINEIEFSGIADSTGLVRISCPIHGSHDMRVMPGGAFKIKCAWVQE